MRWNSPTPILLACTLCLAVCQTALAADLELTDGVDQSPLAVKVVPAFTKLHFAGWEEEINGKANPLRPILLTHAGDGSNRVFVPQQQGQIHVFPNDASATTTKIFLDLSNRVDYADNENEEGLLGLAFHPNFAKNGEFFVHYTAFEPPHTSVVSRFKVLDSNPQQADPNSEEVLLRVTHPFWNHKGGTLCFGPDGMLYTVLGDGGAGNDPFGNGQNLQTLLGKILRIDVNKKTGSLAYGIPEDNPFVDRRAERAVIARPEIYAYGLRNVWRMSFDRQTGALWAADVGQNLWEEINLIVNGGNYGWNHREGKHPFAPNGDGPRPDLVDPIWEYAHDQGKSITGGNVYRGTKVPELFGHYLYADYVSGKMWALKYDDGAQRVVANRSITLPGVMPVISFGEDEPGEVYFTIVSPNGQGIFTFASDEKSAAGSAERK